MFDKIQKAFLEENDLKYKPNFENSQKQDFKSNLTSQNQFVR